MKKMLNSINLHNIQELYGIKCICDSGQIEMKLKNITVYKIDPASIIACDEETKFKIYQAYITCVRGLPDNFQMVISKEKANFELQIRNYEQRLRKIDNDKLKIAIKKYIEYLKEISNINKMYKTNHYLIVENLNQNDLQQIVSIFSNLKEFGIKITKISSKEEIEKVLRKCILKDETI